MVLIGSPGDVEIVADKTTVADLVTNDGDDTAQSNFVGTGKWARQKTGWIVFETINTIQSAAWGIVAAAETIYHAIYHRTPTEGKCGWDKMSGKDWATGLAGFVSPLISLGVMAKGLHSTFSRDPNNDHGNISLYAAAGFSAYGQTTATLHAEVSASVTSFLSASLTSNVTTSVSSDLLMAISGTMTTLGGMASVGVSSQFGSATMSGKSSATVSSYGKVFVTGHGPVQVNSVNDSAYLHGQAGFYVGCGAGTGTPVSTAGLQFGVLYMTGPGYGILGDPNKGLIIGRMKEAYVFGAPNPDNTPELTQQIKISDDGITIKHKATDITIANNEVTIGKNGKRVNIG
jgi:hypothetical protein